MPKWDIAKQVARLQVAAGLVLAFSFFLPMGHDPEGPADIPAEYFYHGGLGTLPWVGAFFLPLLLSIAVLRTKIVWLRALLAFPLLALLFGVFFLTGIMGRGLMGSGTMPMIGMWVAHYSVLVLAGASLTQIPLALIRSIEQRDTVSTALSSIAAAIVVFGLAFALHAVFRSSGDVEVAEPSRERLIIEKSGTDIQIIAPSRCRNPGDPMHLSQSGIPLPLCEE